VRGIYPLVDDDPRWRHPVRAQLEAALAGGARVVQLRLKRTRDREALALVRESAAKARAAGVLLIVNDRFDLAELGGADGVHLGQDDVPPERLPASARERLLVGLSTHTRAQLHEALARPADYLAFGPVFGTASKASAFAARGLEELAACARLCDRPLVAIGGIHAGNVALVRRAGAAAAALISAVADAVDPAGETRRLQALFEGAG
jgi:thiamine-phosphate pyrophosphorylase